VKVKIVADSVGSFGMHSKGIKEIKESGAELLFFSHWLQRTHKKILIIDEKIAFLGGVNIHEVFRKWNDLQIRMDGAIVKSVLRSFSRTYHLCGGVDSAVLVYDKATVFRKARSWLVEQWGTERTFLKKQYRQIIKDAQKNIIIVTPYFAPPRWMIAALHGAVLRGVNVEVILPKVTDHWVMNQANHYYMCFMGKLGVKFYLTKNMNHAKALLVDDAEGMIGSQNIDALSFDSNIEVGVFFTNKNMVASLKKIFDNWKKDAEVFNYLGHRTRWFDRILAPFIRFFQPIL